MEERMSEKKNMTGKENSFHMENFQTVYAMNESRQKEDIDGDQKKAKNSR